MSDEDARRKALDEVVEWLDGAARELKGTTGATWMEVAADAMRELRDFGYTPPP